MVQDLLALASRFARMHGNDERFASIHPQWIEKCAIRFQLPRIQKAFKSDHTIESLTDPNQVAELCKILEFHIQAKLLGLSLR